MYLLPVRYLAGTNNIMPSVLLGIFELFTMFYGAEENSEVAKIFRRVDSKLVENQNEFLEISSSMLCTLKTLPGRLSIVIATLPVKTQEFG